MTSATRFSANAELQPSQMEKINKTKSRNAPITCPGRSTHCTYGKMDHQGWGFCDTHHTIRPLLTAPRKRSRTRHKFSIPRRDAPELYLILPSRREGAGNAGRSMHP